MNRLFPRPVMTFILAVIWMYLNNNISFGSFLLGGFFGWLIPFTVNPILLKPSPGWKPMKLIKLLAIVVHDIFVQNFAVAKLNLGPVRRLEPAFLEVPIDLKNDTAISILVSIVSMTPGTIAADLSGNKRSLLIHGLDVPNPEAVIAEIKERYEAPLKEIYPC